ncbi:MULTISPECIES: PhzF family phenazine biosynthesis protein [Vibrio]|uniref:PhzF family phenazine biosynthesis protein n=1 Tax=Vibrio TaxID=662 RepID=UPI0020762B56|nr:MULTISPECIES: PhzF family phenazine biosynthesis protein [Vibrio]USD33580.1 PhzF family phenazine biosynthesis protein [Vibrio sp. SCSIO 43186]USD46648.1 PhzF family phenazine biosynthesis protein [Vibrio sp. SCSIO 43145]USD70704.1 PhzF family phenazine biosynthesis protein [Vibrio sp. SCSIO 43139]USD95622.1 phenazine biosynthesis protein PhzF [Vibrio coralliilyticus]
MELDIYQVDSFTSETFKGNPAGVCITDQPLDESLMFAIAAEMAVSETAFLSLNDMRLRWFTPAVEVKLCGHGTLAVAHVLKQQGKIRTGDNITFNTLSGLLNVKVLTSTYELDFPTPELKYNPHCSEERLNALGLSEQQVMSYCQFDDKELFELTDEQAVHDLSPDFSSLVRQPGRGIIVTARSTQSDSDIISRYFAPWVGVNEDPVTGSAHCALAEFWAGTIKKSVFTAYQASSRGGYLDIKREGNGRVKISGSAVTALKGTLFI